MDHGNNSDEVICGKLYYLFLSFFNFRGSGMLKKYSTLMILILMILMRFYYKIDFFIKIFFIFRSRMETQAPVAPQSPLVSEATYMQTRI